MIRLDKFRELKKEKYTIERITVFFCFLMIIPCVYADSLWSTGAGRAFYTSVFGQLIFALFKLVGMFYAIKSLCLWRSYFVGTQTSCPPWTCFFKLVASVWLFYAAASMNIIYNSF